MALSIQRYFAIIQYLNGLNIDIFLNDYPDKNNFINPRLYIQHTSSYHTAHKTISFYHVIKQIDKNTR
jgi:hypothetical protein